jgi:hypothetical protein
MLRIENQWSHSWHCRDRIAVCWILATGSAHQTQTRLYFDLLRNGGEQNYLRLLPPGERNRVLSRWYQGSGQLKLDYSYAEMENTAPSQVSFATSAHNEELGARLLQNFTEQLVDLWGVRRTHPQFWDVLHDITRWHREHQPLQAGVFDINRYKNL